MGKPRDWNAVDAHFRRGGPMKDRRAPRGGANRDQEIEDELDRYQTEEAKTATDALFKATPEELGQAAISGSQNRESLQEEEEQNAEE